MYYLILQACKFNGKAYRPGDVLDLADAEQAENLLREVGPAVAQIAAPPPVAPKAPPVVAKAPAQVAENWPAEPPPKAPKAKRSRP